MKTLLAATLALSLAAGSALAAPMPPPATQVSGYTPTAEEMADLQCLAVFVIMANEPEKLTLAMGGYMFFLSRLDTRNPRTDWIAQLSAYAARTANGEHTRHLQRCQETVLTQLNRLEAIAS